MLVYQRVHVLLRIMDVFDWSIIPAGGWGSGFAQAFQNCEQWLVVWNHGIL